jgi:hypothetical protein
MNYAEGLPLVEGGGTYVTGVAPPKAVLKYEEDRYLKEFEEYIANTYKAHYAVSNGVQSFDLIHATGRAEGFILGSILKYATRFGRKNGNNRKDILKIVHYCLLLLFTMDQKEKTTNV